MTNAISLRLPERVTHELDKLAGNLDRPRSYLIRKAIETYLAEYADYQLALTRLHDKNDAVVSSPEMRRSLGL